jgi:hypothetical protein
MKGEANVGKQLFSGSGVDLKESGELDVSEEKAIIEFSEELSDGGERDEFIDQQMKN